MKRLGASGAAVLGVLILSCVASCSADAQRSAGQRESPPRTPVVLVPRVHARYPHDPRAFTQGLLWARGQLFESTGLQGRSSVRQVELASGAVVRKSDDDSTLFGEGLALVDDHLVQLTWQDHIALFWKLDDLSLARRVSYAGEGWGLCFDGKSLVMSDGSATLYFRNKSSFAVERKVNVLFEGLPVPNLNELECVSDRIYANVWQSDRIMRIDPSDGRVEAVIDASQLLQSRDGVDVLNGIAFIPERGRFLLTGKLWPTVFEVTFEPPEETPGQR